MIQYIIMIIVYWGYSLDKIIYLSINFKQIIMFFYLSLMFNLIYTILI